MTDKEQLELIAQAREKLLREIKFENDKIVYNSQNKQPFILAMATTHLAEMDEHKWQQVGLLGIACEKCSRVDFKVQYPCDFLVTKAKRLLGVE